MVSPIRGSMKSVSVQELEKKPTVTQSNPLARSAQNMSLYEKKLILVAISKLRRDQTDFDIIELPIHELSKLWKVDARNIYKAAKETSLSLLKQTIYIGGDNAEEGWTAFNWVSKARYIPAKKHPSGMSVIELNFHDDLKPLLLHLTRDFNSVPLRELLAIESVSSIRLFEILYHDSFRGSRSILRYELNDLKKRIGLENKYEKFKDFRYVLERAQKDFEESTSLTFSFKGELEGRTCTHVVFSIFPNARFKSDSPEQPVLAVELQEVTLLRQKLIAAGFVQDPHEFIQRFGVERIEANLAIAKKKHKEAASTKNPIKNLGGLIVYMVERDIAKNEQVQQSSHAALNVEQAARTVVDLLVHERSNQADSLWKFLSKVERENFHDIMRVELNRSLIASLDNGGWKGRSYESIRNKLVFFRYQEKFPNDLQSVKSFVLARSLLSDIDTLAQTTILSRVEELLN